MHTLTVVFGPGGGWEFLFKTKEAADKAYDAFTNKVRPSSEISIEDDYGQRAVFKNADWHGVMVADMNVSGQVVVERSLHQARMQNQANRQVQTDPTLSGPKIHSPTMPMVNGMGPRN